MHYPYDGKTPIVYLGAQTWSKYMSSTCLVMLPMTQTGRPISRILQGPRSTHSA